jgi:hypothetical protein
MRFTKISARPQSSTVAAFHRLKTLARTWETDSPAGGKLTSTFVPVSKGTAIEQSIGAREENECRSTPIPTGASLMQPYCAFTARGNQVRWYRP